MEITRKKFRRTIPPMAVLGAENAQDPAALTMMLRQMQGALVELQRQIDALNNKKVTVVDEGPEPKVPTVPDTSVNDEDGLTDITWQWMHERLFLSTDYSEDAEADGAPIRYGAFYEVSAVVDLTGLPTDVYPVFAYVTGTGDFYFYRVEINTWEVVPIFYYRDAYVNLPASSVPAFGFAIDRGKFYQWIDGEWEICPVLYNVTSSTDLPEVDAPAVGYVNDDDSYYGLSDTEWKKFAWDEDATTWEIVSAKVDLSAGTDPALGYVTSTGRCYMRANSVWLCITHLEA